MRLNCKAFYFMVLGLLAGLVSQCSSKSSRSQNRTAISVAAIEGPQGQKTDGTGGGTSEGDGASEGQKHKRLMVQHSGKCLAVRDLGDKGSQVTQLSCSGDTSQRWEFSVEDGKPSQVKAVASGLCLEVKDGGLDDRALVQLAACKADLPQQIWQLSPQPGNEASEFTALMATHSKRCLDVEKRSPDDGAKLIQWECAYVPNQLWSVGTWEPEQNETKGPSLLWDKKVSCATRPKVTMLGSSQPWRSDMHNNNDFYANIFTPVVHYKGHTYWVWVDTNYVPHVSKFGAKEEQALLAPNYKVRTNEHNVVFSLGIDRDGYLHISGDMQNGPQDRTTDYPEAYRSADILYWRSKLPESVEGGFEFIGSGQGTIPAYGVNGISFYVDNFGELYAGAHVDAADMPHEPGLKAVGLYRYRLATRRWEALGGHASWEKEDADLKKYVVLFWDIGGVTGGWFQGIFYRFRFDLQNRLHFATAINTNNKLPYNERLLYAVRVENKWQRVDGSVIPSLPMRAIDGHASQASLVRKDEQRSFHWAINVTVDRLGQPAVWAESPSAKWQRRWFSWDGSKWDEDTIAIDPAQHDNGLIAPGGALLVTGRDTAEIICYDTLNAQGVTFDLEGYNHFVNGDEYGLRTTGVLYGVAINKDKGTRALLKIDYSASP